MLAFKREAVAPVVLAFYFLVLDQQTHESRLQQLLLLQHLKRSRRKWLILLQIGLCKTRRVSPAWSWPRNQFWFETLLNGIFVVDRNQTWKLSPKPCLENVIEWGWRNPDPTWCEILWGPQADVSVIQTLVTDLNHACSQGKRNFYLS